MFAVKGGDQLMSYSGSGVPMVTELPLDSRLAAGSQVPEIGVLFGGHVGRVYRWDGDRLVDFESAGSWTKSQRMMVPFAGGFLLGSEGGQVQHYAPSRGYCDVEAPTGQSVRVGRSLGARAVVSPNNAGAGTLFVLEE